MVSSADHSTGQSQYTGRFAPSPTGPLHLGSLVSALGSWADAKHHNGTWLVRIEDIDPARESPEACEQIIESLRAHHLHWDNEIVYQHQRSSLYNLALDRLRQQQRLYACTCTRKQLRALPSSVYPGNCRNLKHPEEDKALRVCIDSGTTRFTDIVYGLTVEDVSRTVGDFIVRRRGPLYAYQLAVVVDDDEQRITHVVRGADLLDNTARQIALQHLLKLRTPHYLHLPLVLQDDGRKLSKQTGAVALDNSTPLNNLKTAWNALGQTPAPETLINCQDFLDYCAKHWSRDKIPSTTL